ncbi:MAG: methyl-accepting chemotaxis protein [Pseudomonadota bacterium]
MPVRQRLMMIVAIPLALLVLLEGRDTLHALDLYGHESAVAADIPKVAAAGDLIHALQRERGTSSGWVSSNGRAFRDALARYRDGTDAARARFVALAGEVPGGGRADLAAIRERVDALEATTGEIGTFYTAIIDALLERAGERVRASRNAAVVTDGDAYLALLRAKELAGLERAAGAIGFGAGRISNDVQERLISLRALQRHHFDVALGDAVEEDRAALSAFLRSSAQNRVADLRAAAMGGARGESIVGIGPGDWWQATTVRIDALKVLEDRFGATWADALRGVEQRARHELYLSLALVLFTIATSVAFAVISAGSLARPLVALHANMEAIAERSYDVEIAGTGRRDEIGEMAGALAHLRDGLAAAEAANRLAVFKGTAFDRSSNAMFMIDRGFVITYVNPAAETLFAAHAETFRQLWPRFDHRRLLGLRLSRIDAIGPLADALRAEPDTLPIETDISIGELKIALSVSGIFDEAGDFVGHVLEWEEVTEARQNAAVIAAIQAQRATAAFPPDSSLSAANAVLLDRLGHGAYADAAMAILKEGRTLRREGDRQAFWARLCAGSVVDAKFHYQLGDGREIWFEATFYPVIDAQGETFRIFAVATDITAREAERQALAAQRAQVEAERTTVVEALSVNLRKFADGDLTAEIATPLAPDYDQLRIDFNGAIAALRGTIQSVVQATEEVRGGAHQISSAADDLSHRTETQAATLEETAAALNQLTESVRTTADGADETRASVERARQNAETSGAVMREAVAAMDGIARSSSQISSIIRLIDDIAFQTNLLALNAGVEAARAGDAGRGFAVVATEVRALAQRSASAAKEIKDLISTSTDQVGQGVELVGQAGQALEEIVASVAEISGRMVEIAEAARQQSLGLAEVNAAAAQLDQVTQQNAGMVEEATAASHGLMTQAEGLSHRMERFRTDAVGHTPEPSDGQVSVASGPTPREDGASWPNGATRAPFASQDDAIAWREF